MKVIKRALDDEVTVLTRRTPGSKVRVILTHWKRTAKPVEAWDDEEPKAMLFAVAEMVFGIKPPEGQGKP